MKIQARLGKNKKRTDVIVSPHKGMRQTGLALYPQKAQGIESILNKTKDGNINVKVYLLNTILLEKSSSNFDISPFSHKKAREVLRHFPFSVETFIDLEDLFLSEVKRLLCDFIKTGKCTGSMKKMIDTSIKLQIFGDMSHHKTFFNKVLSCKSIPKLRCQ
uniref:Uncharacterized protein n=1 Tax=viral metagenome TaxID=1070528 RepID=A0A6C0J0M6_9ZZZZ